MKSNSNKSHDIPLLGKSLRLSPLAKDRVLSECYYLDVPDASCEDAFRAPFFRDYFEFQLQVGGVDKDDISLIEDGAKGQVFELNFAGTTVTLFVVYDEDSPLTMDVELVDGFDFFDAYHEQWIFQPLPDAADTTTTAQGATCSNIKHHPETIPNGCRVIHSFIGIFSQKCPLTREEWTEGGEEEVMNLYDLLTED